MGKVLIIKDADFSAVAVCKVTPGNKVKISVIATPSGGGTVTGDGSYDEGTTVTIKATPSSGYKFTQWDDGNSNASRTITVGSSPKTYTATFVVSGKQEIQKTSEHDGLMSASVGGTVEYSQEETFSKATYVYDIPAGYACILENIASGGAYPFAIAKTSDNEVVEKTTNAKIVSAGGSYTFATQNVACKLYASMQKLGNVYIEN